MERTADPSERMPILPVLQGHTKNSPLPPSLQGPCVVLVTFEHFKLFYLLCFYNYFTMHFNKKVLLCYFITFDCCNCRIHHVTASMTTIDLIIKPRTELLEPVTTLFKLAAPSISSSALCIYFSQFYLCYCLVRIRCRH